MRPRPPAAPPPTSPPNEPAALGRRPESHDDRPDNDGMGAGPAPAAAENSPVTSLLDPRAIQMMSTEHWSLLSARSLAYNEAFVRGGMFLTFLSMSFVALALVASAMSFDGDFLAIAAIVLGFDLVIGLGTYGRILGANIDDYRALHGMARIRHGYTEIAPVLARYFTTSVNDDEKGVLVSYGNPATGSRGQILHALTTSSGMIAQIVSLLTGVFALVVVLLAGLPLALGFGVAAVAIIAMFASLALVATRYFRHEQGRLTALFPTPPEAAADAAGKSD